MKARELNFQRGGKSLREFVKAHHYSKTCPPSQYYFSATFEEQLVGVCVFRIPSLPKVRQAYGAELELVRLVLLDEAEKNSESRFIGWCLAWVRKNTPTKNVLSFADPRFGHSGTIYKASNFKYLGNEKGHGTRRIFIDGREWHSKSAFDAFGCSGAGLKKILSGRRVEIVVCPPKHVFIYNLR